MPADPHSNGAGRNLRYVDAINEALAQALAADPRVFVFGLDVDDHKGIQGSTKGLPERFGAERVFGTPLSEEAMTGIAVGAAIAGLRPVHVHIRMDFLMLCMNQLVNMAAKSRYMYGGAVSCPLVVRAIIGKSWGQGAQHSQGLHSIFMHVPGLKVVAPSNPHDAKGCLLQAIRDDDPVIFVEHRLLYDTEAPVPEADFAVPFGRARVCRRGADVTIVGISAMLPECLGAAELLARAGVEAEVIDPISLSPLDVDTIAASVERTRRLLVVDTAWTMCGASAEIVAAVAERLGGGGALSLQRMGHAPATCPTSPWLEAEYYPDMRKIAAHAFAMARPNAAAWVPPADTGGMTRKPFRGPF
jgi:acetoin:2,6-dichlorophenolindophenol oxidoreductase subunit beta